MTEYETIAPEHAEDLRELPPYVIEGVAYSPLRVTYLCNYDEGTPIYCESCAWETTVGDLPSDSGTVHPNMCPLCAKEGEIGWTHVDHRAMEMGGA